MCLPSESESVDPASHQKTEYPPFYALQHERDGETIFWHAERRSSLEPDDPGTELFLALRNLRRIVIVANLKPHKFRGIESRGMLLAAGGHEPGEALGLVTLDVEKEILNRRVADFFARHLRDA